MGRGTEAIDGEVAVRSRYPTVVLLAWLVGLAGCGDDPRWRLPACKVGWWPVLTWHEMEHAWVDVEVMEPDPGEPGGFLTSRKLVFHDLLVDNQEDWDELVTPFIPSTESNALGREPDFDEEVAFVTADSWGVGVSVAFRGCTNGSETYVTRSRTDSGADMDIDFLLWVAVERRNATTFSRGLPNGRGRAAR